MSKNHCDLQRWMDDANLARIFESPRAKNDERRLYFLLRGHFCQSLPHALTRMALGVLLEQ
jgi:hypothetical protein